MRHVRIFTLLFWIFASAYTAHAADEFVVPEITVLGQSESKKSVGEYLPTVTEISGRKLEHKKESTLGETLSKEAGVTSSFFGPNSSRPVIRGLDGERVRILQNGIGTQDASGTSPDHAVPVDPFLVERVEIVRGSAALLYGSSAIGGVVNTINTRIPDRLNIEPSVRASTKISSVDFGRSAGFMVNKNAGPFSLHFDWIGRKSNNYSIPGYARSARLRSLDPLSKDETEITLKVPNSQSQALDGAVGGSYIFNTGYLGASVSGYDGLYGTVAEPDVTIDMKRQRLDLAGEVRDLSWAQSARYKGAMSHYKHQEFEGDEIGTTFRNRGIENRLDIKHRKLGLIEGVVGAQQQYSKFSAIGEEAFLPTTDSSSLAIFSYEELPLGNWVPSLGARVDRSWVQSLDDDKFGASETKLFWAPSVSGGVLYHLTPEFNLGFQETLTQRAPNYQELFADGQHVATGVFEKGDRNLKNEIGNSHELSLRHKTQTGEGRISTFLQDYSRFIAVLPTSEIDEETHLPVFQYSPIRARLYGAEFEYRQQLPWRLASGFFELDGKIDLVRGLNRSNSTHLSRIPPMRESLAVNYRVNALSTMVEYQRSEAQGLVAKNEITTDAYQWVNLGAETPVNTFFGVLHFQAKVNNLFNVEARNHVSFLKDRAPLPGRNFVLSVQASL